MKKLFLMAVAFVLVQQTLLARDIYAPYHSNSSYDTYDSDIGYTESGYLNQLLSSMANQLTRNKDFMDIEKPTLAVTSFVCLQNFKATSPLSNIISENLIHELQIRGFKVVDFKTMNNIKIDERGDFLFSRNVAKLRKSLNINYALTGTYVQYREGMVVNARIIDLNTHIILSTAQILIPRHTIKHLLPRAPRGVNLQENKVTLTRE